MKAFFSFGCIVICNKSRFCGNGEKTEGGENTETMIPIITAVISGCSAAAASILVAVIQSRSQHNQVLAEMDKRDALQAQRIEQLEKKMDKHNRLIERTYALEKDSAVLKNDIKVVNHRIDDLEEK